LEGVFGMRQSRKIDHIRWAVDLPEGPRASGLEDIRLVHNALTELSSHEVNTEVEVFKRSLKMPLIINAMTGGNPQVLEINRSLARAARSAGIGMAVGSQTGALLDPDLTDTFMVVREENPDGLIIANTGAGVVPREALRAVDMIRADALQVHLNSAQELAMSEGDLDFRGRYANIRELIIICPVPVIVKEVGFGISREVAQKLAGIGVQWIDVGGAGGTNFVAIEHRRAQPTAVPEDWGIHTAASLAEVIAACPQLQTVTSGGIRSPLDAVKALALGSTLVGIAGLWMKTLRQRSYEDLVQELENFQRDFTRLMLLLGARNITELRRSPLVITGFTGEWLRERGVDTGRWAQR